MAGFSIIQELMRRAICLGGLGLGTTCRDLGKLGAALGNLPGNGQLLRGSLSMKLTEMVDVDGYGINILRLIDLYEKRDADVSLPLPLCTVPSKAGSLQ